MKWLVLVFLLLSGCAAHQVRIGNTSVVAEIADTPQEWAQGLQHRTALGAHEGMLFVFPQPRTATFWMKNTLVPLDMIFIDGEKHIRAIEKSAQPCTQDPCPIYSHENISFVLEANAGFTERYSVQVNDSVFIH